MGKKEMEIDLRQGTSTLPPVPGEWRCAKCKPSALRNLGPRCAVCGCLRETSFEMRADRERLQREMRAALERVQPAVCCKKQKMRAGGKVTLHCSDACRWSAMEREIATVFAGAGST